APSLPLVEADVCPVGSQLMRLERPPGRVADHERDAVAAQELVDLGRKPRLVTELEAVTAAWQRLERSREPLVVAPKAGRQLPQHRAELWRLDQRADARVEEFDARR